MKNLQPEPTGYAHSAYAESLAEVGTPRLLPSSGGWVLERSIEGFEAKDLMGCYPIFACRDWSKLHEDLEAVADDLVCLSLVTDPFSDQGADYLSACFPDVMKPFKEHFIVDLTQPPDDFIDPHHRRNSRRALRQVEVTTNNHPIHLLDDWSKLYGQLVARHQIKGMTAFSRASFEAQLKVPGIVAVRAEAQGETVGMLLWYGQADRAYYHLGAYSSRGYDLRASFALFRYSLDYFAQQGFRWVNLGAGAGASPDAESGLTRFKRGWSTGTRTAYFCGRIFNQRQYEQIVAARRLPPTNYFPAYRVGEFN